MSLMAEVVVEEWLNRQGYFTIRGIKLGVDEIDILALRPQKGGGVERRHIEVQVSVRPMSYITPVSKAAQKATGRRTSAKKRSDKDLAQAVKEWVDKKYRKKNKRQLLSSLGEGDWSQEFVIHKVKYQEEVELIRRHGIRILRFADIVKELRSSKTPIKAASGSDLLELMLLATVGDEVMAEALEAVADINDADE